MENNGNTLDLFSKAVACDVQMRKAGNQRKVDTRKVETDADRRLLHLTKKLIDSDAYEKIGSRDGEFRRWLMTYAVPCPQFRTGIYLIPFDLLSKVEKEFEIYQQEREKLIDALISERDQLIEQARFKLGSLFQQSDYIPLDQYRTLFSVELTYLSLNAPEALERVNKDLFQREQAKIKRQWEEAGRAMCEALRQDFEGFVSLLTENIRKWDEKAQGNGKKIQFREAVVTNLREFCETFRSRNLTDDRELEELVSQVENLIGDSRTGLTPGEIKASPTIRAGLRQALTDLASNAEKLVEEAPKRRFRLDRD